MQNVIKTLLCIVFIVFTMSVVHAQERINIPKTIAIPKAALPFDAKIMSAPDQIGFRKLSIDDTNDTDYKEEKYTGSSYRSISLYLGLHEKEFRKWETQTFNAALLDINLNLGTAPKTPLSLFGVPISLGYRAPGNEGIKLNSGGSGIPPIYPIQARQYNDLKKYVDRIEQDMHEKWIGLPLDGEELFDEVLCYVSTYLISRQNNSFLSKLL